MSVCVRDQRFCKSDCVLGGNLVVIDHNDFVMITHDVSGYVFVVVYIVDYQLERLLKTAVCFTSIKYPIIRNID